MISYLYQRPVDNDAKEFLNAAGITNGDIATAIEALVRELKEALLWPYLKAIYPMVGGTLSTCKYNLKDPRDVDAAFRLTWYNAPVVDDKGVSFNGTTQRADTHFVPSVQLTVNAHAGIYVLSGGGPWTSGAKNSGTGPTYGIGSRSTFNEAGVYMGTNFTLSYLSKGTLSGIGYLIGSHTGNNLRLVRNGVLTGSATSTTSQYSNIPHAVSLGAMRDVSNIHYYDTCKIGFYHMGLELSAAQAITLSGIVNDFMIRMNKNTYS